MKAPEIVTVNLLVVIIGVGWKMQARKMQAGKMQATEIINAQINE
jgi:hypothetical protein